MLKEENKGVKQCTHGINPHHPLKWNIQQKARKLWSIDFRVKISVPIPESLVLGLSSIHPKEATFLTS